MTLAALGDFVNEDIDNVVQLFYVFNDGTHGSSGKYDLRPLLRHQERVEDGIMYLANLVN